MEIKTNIQVEYDVWKELNNLKDPGESFNDILKKILAHNRKNGIKNK